MRRNFRLPFAVVIGALSMLVCTISWAAGSFTRPHNGDNVTHGDFITFLY
jgi:hypothetical protein